MSRSYGRRLDLDVGDDVADARGRLLGPVDAGEELLHAAAQRVLALVEPVDVQALAGELALPLVVGDVAPHGHEVARVVGEQIEPLLVAPLVEQLGLAVEEVLHLVAQEQAGQVGRAHVVARSFQDPASMNWRQRV